MLIARMGSIVNLNVTLSVEQQNGFAARNGPQIRGWKYIKSLFFVGKNRIAPN
jgi:hypothetical protein